MAARGLLAGCFRPILMLMLSSRPLAAARRPARPLPLRLLCIWTLTLTLVLAVRALRATRRSSRVLPSLDHLPRREGVVHCTTVVCIPPRASPAVRLAPLAGRPRPCTLYL